MKHVLAFLIAFFALPALADAVFTGDGFTIRLQNTPCVAPVALLVKDTVLPHAKAGVVTVGTREMQLCWAVLREGMVTVLDEEGGGGSLPLNAFKEQPGS